MYLGVAGCSEISMSMSISRYMHVGRHFAISAGLDARDSAFQYKGGKKHN